MAQTGDIALQTVTVSSDGTSLTLQLGDVPAGEYILAVTSDGETEELSQHITVANPAATLTEISDLVVLVPSPAMSISVPVTIGVPINASGATLTLHGTWLQGATAEAIRDQDPGSPYPLGTASEDSNDDSPWSVTVPAEALCTPAPLVLTVTNPSPADPGQAEQTLDVVALSIGSFKDADGNPLATITEGGEYTVTGGGFLPGVSQWEATIIDLSQDPDIRLTFDDTQSAKLVVGDFTGSGRLKLTITNPSNGAPASSDTKATKTIDLGQGVSAHAARSDVHALRPAIDVSDGPELEGLIDALVAKLSAPQVVHAKLRAQLRGVLEKHGCREDRIDDVANDLLTLRSKPETEVREGAREIVKKYRSQRGPSTHSAATP
jgi:hypothetical protein